MSFDKDRWESLNKSIYEMKQEIDYDKQKLKELVYERNHLYLIFHSQNSSSNAMLVSPINFP